MTVFAPVCTSLGCAHGTPVSLNDAQESVTRAVVGASAQLHVLYLRGVIKFSHMICGLVLATSALVHSS